MKNRCEWTVPKQATKTKHTRIGCGKWPKSSNTLILSQSVLVSLLPLKWLAQRFFFGRFVHLVDFSCHHFWQFGATIAQTSSFECSVDALEPAANRCAHRTVFIFAFRVVFFLRLDIVYFRWHHIHAAVLLFRFFVVGWKLQVWSSLFSLYFNCAAFTSYAASRSQPRLLIVCVSTFLCLIFIIRKICFLHYQFL